ncbi:FAD/NAD(P)-binding oxidoreductase [Zoogloea sp.]|uniref:FAD-dependent oxidoreductase n=1 Tax=Zoogloea sp. TaxID=49181 RepID=UPI0026191CC5|nr:FAD/NAD(P)-binding oxidoreductase [Zoogloea sp.]MDD3353067.1 FAD/NAD(P)-binding oxidoreductase [Zoogloea sp.]
MNRRDFLLTPPAMALGMAGAPLAAMAGPAILTRESRILPREGKGPRVVICGGGWGGMTAARYLRQLIPNAEVILLERNPTFWSGPMSNKWLIDVVSTDFVHHDAQHPANVYGYTRLQTEVIGFERERRLVRTAHGLIDYDFLILSGGIRNAYDAWFGNDQKAIDHTRNHYPSAYIPNAEMLALKQKVKNFKGGTLVMTLPPPPHRCPPSPYERACLIAWHIKKNKIPGKILILDPKPKVAPISMGYQTAFRELYPDIITHIPNAGVQEVDPFNKRIKTLAGEFKFDDAILMPPHQAAEMVWQAGLIGKTPDGKPTGWADMDPRFFHARSDDRVYFVGDLMGHISSQFGHYPKSAHVANYIGRIVARNIAERVAGKEVIARLPDNLCYMMVNADPQEAISVKFEYEVDAASGNVHQTQIDEDVRTNDLVKEDFVWIKDKFSDFLAL